MVKDYPASKSRKLVDAASSSHKLPFRRYVNLSTGQVAENLPQDGCNSSLFICPKCKTKCLSAAGLREHKKHRHGGKRSVLAIAAGASDHAADATLSFPTHAPFFTEADWLALPSVRANVVIYASCPQEIQLVDSRG